MIYNYIVPKAPYKVRFNSYPAKVVLGSYPKVRIEPACNNFVALVEVVPEGIRTNFTLVT